MATRDPGAAEVRLVGPCNADCQFDSVIGEVEYLISYPVAVPELPSSPGAVQFRLMQAGDGQVSRRAWEIDADRLVIVDGGVVSPLPSGVGDGVGTGVGVGEGAEGAFLEMEPAFRLGPNGDCPQDEIAEELPASSVVFTAK